MQVLEESARFSHEAEDRAQLVGVPSILTTPCELGELRSRSRRIGVLEVIVGVALTAVLGGLLVPSLKGSLDRRSEQFKSSVALVETLADSLWSYWKLALRVAYHGREGERGTKELAQALR